MSVKIPLRFQMKGVPSNNVHYEYKIDRRKDRLFSTFIPPQQIEDDGGKIIGQFLIRMIGDCESSSALPRVGANIEYSFISWSIFRILRIIL